MLNVDEWRVVGGLMFQSKRELCSGEIRGEQGKAAGRESRLKQQCESSEMCTLSLIYLSVKSSP
jgi:hypothetical protein